MMIRRADPDRRVNARRTTRHEARAGPPPPVYPPRHGLDDRLRPSRLSSGTKLNGKAIAVSGSHDGTVRVWDLAAF